MSAEDAQRYSSLIAHRSALKKVFMRLRFAILLAFFATNLFAVAPQFWRVRSLEDFLSGDIDGFAVTSRGELRAAPELKKVLEGKPSVEVRRRAEGLLKKLDGPEAIGQQRRPEMAEWLREIDVSTGGTTNPKVFTGGDAVNGGASVVEAVRDGKRAASAIDRWLRCAS